jgi:hypothetical protein
MAPVSRVYPMLSSLVPDPRAKARAWHCGRSAYFWRRDRMDAEMRHMTDDKNATPAAPDPDDHVARLQAEIDAVKARRAGYRAQAAETVARGGPTRPRDEELGIIKTDDTVGKIAADASQEIGSRLSRLMSRFRRGAKK